jgi:hypothetical protein
MDHGVNNLRHALDNTCTDPDCEIHHPDVGIQEGTVSLTDLAFFVAGAAAIKDQLLNEVEDAFETIFKENFVHYHEEAFRLYPGPLTVKLDRNVETDLSEDR